MNDDAYSKANRFLALRKSTDVALTGDTNVDALLKEAEELSRPSPAATKPKPAATKAPQPTPAPKPAPIANPPAVSAPQQRPAVAVQSETPGVTAEVLPPEKGGQDGQNITVVVNVQQAPVVAAYPWWGWGYPYGYYPHPVICHRCGKYAHHCGRWTCPY